MSRSEFSFLGQLFRRQLRRNEWMLVRFEFGLSDLALRVDQRTDEFLLQKA